MHWGFPKDDLCLKHTHAYIVIFQVCWSVDPLVCFAQHILAQTAEINFKNLKGIIITLKAISQPLVRQGFWQRPKCDRKKVNVVSL